VAQHSVDAHEVMFDGERAGAHSPEPGPACPTALFKQPEQLVRDRHHVQEYRVEQVDKFVVEFEHVVVVLLVLRCCFDERDRCCRGSVFNLHSSYWCADRQNPPIPLWHARAVDLAHLADHDHPGSASNRRASRADGQPDRTTYDDGRGQFSSPRSGPSCGRRSLSTRLGAAIRRPLAVVLLASALKLLDVDTALTAVVLLVGRRAGRTGVDAAPPAPRFPARPRQERAVAMPIDHAAAVESA
jgi:hypothetical protein